MLTQDRPADGSSPRPVDGRARRYEHRRPELLEAVVEYVLAHGIADLSLRPMAKELGVTHATLLRHFKSKDLLLAEVVAAIRTEVKASWMQRADDVISLPTGEMMRAVWRVLCLPAQHRQFLLLFEVAALGGREPDRFVDLPGLMHTPFVGLTEQNLLHHGYAADDARRHASGFVAMVRGLQVDLALTGDVERVNDAMHSFIELIAPSTGGA